MFKRLDDIPADQAVSFSFDGQSYSAARGENLAAALLAAGVTTTRTTPVSSEGRAPFCMMGACYECLVEIDGESVQACMTEVSDGLAVQKIDGKEVRDSNES